MLYAGEVQSMEKRIRALKAIILVVVMIVELFGVDAVRVVAETINVTGDTTISTEDNRDYAVTDCTLTVSSTGNITGTVYGSGGTIVNQGSINKIEGNIAVDNQAGATIQDLQSSVGITNAGHIISATYSSTSALTNLTNSGTINTLNVKNLGYFDSTATVTVGSGTLDITRVDAKKINLAYTFKDENTGVEISLPAATAKTTQDAPTGLTGGIEKVTGVTTAMEYAGSKTSDTWTQVTGITDSGTLAMERGTWYFRYKETDEKKARSLLILLILTAMRFSSDI